MGLRFRKSIKICKGVKVNFSKSGLSYTIGRKGASLSVGHKGAYLNTGIPGTGISRRDRIIGGINSAPHTHKSYNTTSRTEPCQLKPTLPNEFIIGMNDKGLITIKYANGIDITDQSLIRKIKATPQYQIQKQQLEEQRLNKIDEFISTAEKNSFEFLNLHLMSPIVTSENEFLNTLSSLKPRIYQRRIFSIPSPKEEDIKQSLEKEATENIKSVAFWNLKKLRSEYVNEHLQDRLTEAKNEWNFIKTNFELQEDIEEEKQSVTYNQEFKLEKENLRKAIVGEPDFLSQIINRWFSDCSLPVEININYAYNTTSKTLMLDLDLPEIEDLPTKEYVKLESGNIKEKAKTQTKLREEYATLVFGLAIFVTSNLMNLSPAIKKVILSGYTQRRDSIGNLNDDYIYSIKFLRENFENIDVSHVEPISFCLSFENRCKMTTTKLFKVIEPYTE